LANSGTQVQAVKSDQEIAARLEDLLLHKLRENMDPLSLKELQVKISPIHPVTAITVAASLNRLYKKGQVVKKMVGQARAYYLYSAKLPEEFGLSNGRDL
jgi:predicted transcriptional regulator